MSKSISRRDFFKTTAVGSMIMALAPHLQGAATVIPRRKFGETGMEFSILGFGCGSNFLKAPADKRAGLLEKAIDLGINYFDTAAQYGNRESEKVLGETLPKYRAKIHIGSKTEDRTYDGAMRSIEESLKNLKTDYLDIAHVHQVNPKDDLAAFGKPDGVVTAFRKLRDEKVIKSMALSGHASAEKLKEAIEMYDFNSVLMAMNATSRKAFREIALPTAEKKKMGIIAMKTTLGLVGEGEGKATAAELLQWAWSQPLTAAIVGTGTLDILEQNVATAKAYTPAKKEDEKLVARLMHVSDEQLGWPLPDHVDV